MIALVNANANRIPLPDASVQCCVTSPPYWGLRDYGIDGQLGLEPTPEVYVEHLAQVFREVRRVLRDDGTLWLNLGDSYYNYRPGGISQNKQSLAKHSGAVVEYTAKRNNIIDGLKEKDLVGVPWRVAFALQADGWWLRSDIIWHKPNCMPESVRDRPTKAHEYLFLLTKGARYYYDADAIREPQAESSKMRYQYPRFGPNNKAAHRESCEYAIAGGDYSEAEKETGRNKRTVWTIPTSPYSGAHFATFPPALIEPCIKAGTSERGCCPVCGKGWERVVETQRKKRTTGGHSPKRASINEGGAASSGLVNNTLPISTTIGWQPACDHNHDPIPCTVLDPFVGSGTTLLVARQLGRHGIGLDLSLSYLTEQARTRLELDKLEAWENGAIAEANWQDLPLFTLQPEQAELAL